MGEMLGSASAPSRSIQVDGLVAMLDYITPEARRIDPLCEHLLKMCKMAIIAAERKAANRARRQRLLRRSRNNLPKNIRLPSRRASAP
jgi:hypothetical protein